MLNIEIAHRSDMARIRAFYEAVGYGGGVHDADLAFAATLDGRVVGAVRLCEEAGLTVLRGMYVAPECRRQGVGSALLSACLPWLEWRTAFCLPYLHLADFYGQAGFRPATPETLPRFLAERLAAYLSKGQAVLAMSRHGSAHIPNRSLASRMA